MRRSDYDLITGVIAKALERAAEAKTATSGKIDGVNIVAREMIDALKENDPWLDRARFFREIGRKRQIL